jgi:hypothetical protein
VVSTLPPGGGVYPSQPGGPGPPPQLQPGQIIQMIPCAGVESRIIGKGGQNIRILEAKTGARVRVLTGQKECELTGTPEQVAAAAVGLYKLTHSLKAPGLNP